MFELRILMTLSVKKKLCSMLVNEIFLELRVQLDVLAPGIKLNRELGSWLEMIFYKQDSFLYPG